MCEIKLKDIYKTKGAARILYVLLKERTSRVTISHRHMPSKRKHLAFLRSRPHKAWYLVMNESHEPVGGAYLSKNDEIGIFIFKKHQGMGYGQSAVQSLMRRHRRVHRFLANVNPRNARSIWFFTSLGFRHIQNTYELSRPPEAAKRPKDLKA